MKKKATAGEKFAARYYGWTISQVRHSANALAVTLDREFAKRDAKVAEDVMAIAYNCGAVNGKSYHTMQAAVEAKYGKGTR